MATLGDILRSAREAKGISLADAERETKIRQKYLSALEDDNLSALPGPVYARGFIRNYASYLELDVGEVLRLFDELRQPTRDRIKAARGEPAARSALRAEEEKISIQPLSQERIDTRVRYGSQYIALSLLAIPLLIAFYFIYNAYAGPRSQPAPTPVVAARPATVTPLPASTMTAVADGAGAGTFNTPTVYVPPTPATSAQQTATSTAAGGLISSTIPPADSVTVQVMVSRHESWMSVRVDGVQQFAGTLAIGASRSWKGTSSIQLRVGRADSVRVIVNGADRGFMGTPDNLIVEKRWDNSGNEKIIQP